MTEEIVIPSLTWLVPAVGVPVIVLPAAAWLLVVQPPCGGGEMHAAHGLVRRADRFEPLAEAATRNTGRRLVVDRFLANRCVPLLRLRLENPSDRVLHATGRRFSRSVDPFRPDVRCESRESGAWVDVTEHSCGASSFGGAVSAHGARSITLPLPEGRGPFRFSVDTGRGAQQSLRTEPFDPPPWSPTLRGDRPRLVAKQVCDCRATSVVVALRNPTDGEVHLPGGSLRTPNWAISLWARESWHSDSFSPFPCADVAEPDTLWPRSSLVFDALLPEFDAALVTWRIEVVVDARSILVGPIEVRR